jgi:hypothetical protein
MVHNPGLAVLTNLYITKRLSTRQCAVVLGVASQRTVSRWLGEVGISTRSISEAKQGQKPAPHTVEASVRARRKQVLEGRPMVGYKMRGDGYIAIAVPEHPFATKDGYVLEHRLVMEKHLGRYLLPHEDVHHEDENRQNNALENLKLLTHADHLRQHYHERGVDPTTGRFR